MHRCGGGRGNGIILQWDKGFIFYILKRGIAINRNEKVWQETPAKDRYIDFTDCETWHDMHSQIKTVLELPDFYGKNLDALWDSLTGLMYVPANITIKKGGAKELEAEINKIIEIFEEAKEEYGLLTLTVVEAEQ